MVGNSEGDYWKYYDGCGFLIYYIYPTGTKAHIVYDLTLSGFLLTIYQVSSNRDEINESFHPQKIELKDLFESQANPTEIERTLFKLEFGFDFVPQEMLNDLISARHKMI